MNDFVLSMLPGDAKVYLSSDAISKSDGYATINNDTFSVEFLNTIKCSGLPNHQLSLKKGTPVMLLRNIEPTTTKKYFPIFEVCLLQQNTCLNIVNLH